MADTKLTGLTATTNPATTDIMYVVTDPGGTPTSKKVTIANLVTATSAVVGPGSSTDNAVIRFDGTSGKLAQNSLMTVDDSGKPNIPTGQTYNINGSPHTHAGSSGTDFLVVQVFS